jgi:hypothetical protein
MNTNPVFDFWANVFCCIISVYLIFALSSKGGWWFVGVYVAALLGWHFYDKAGVIYGERKNNK